MRIGKRFGLAGIAALALSALVSAAPVSPALAQSADPYIACVAPRALFTGSSFRVSRDRLFYIRGTDVFRRDTPTGSETRLPAEGSGFSPAQLFALQNGALIAANYSTASGNDRVFQFWLSPDGTAPFRKMGGETVHNVRDVADERSDVFAVAASNGVFLLDAESGFQRIDAAGDVSNILWHKNQLFAGRPGGLYRHVAGSGFEKVEGGFAGAVSGLFEIDGHLLFMVQPEGQPPSFQRYDDDLKRMFVVRGYPVEGAKGAFAPHYLALGSWLMRYDALRGRFTGVFGAMEDQNAVHIQTRTPVAVLEAGTRVFVSYSDLSEQSGSVLEWDSQTRDARVLPQPAMVIDTMFVWKGAVWFANTQPSRGALHGGETTPWLSARVALEDTNGFGALDPVAAKPTPVSLTLTHPCAPNMDGMALRVSATSSSGTVSELAVGEPMLKDYAGGDATRAFRAELPLNGQGRYEFGLSFPAGAPVIGETDSARLGPLLNMALPDVSGASGAARLGVLLLAGLFLVAMPLLFIAARWSVASQRLLAAPVLSKIIWPAFLPRFLPPAQNWLLASYFRTRRRRGGKRGSKRSGAPAAADIPVAAADGARESGAALIDKLARENHIWLDGGVAGDRAALFLEWRARYFGGDAASMAAARAKFGFAAIFIEAAKHAPNSLAKNRPELWVVDAALRALKDARCEFADVSLMEALFRSEGFALVLDSADGREEILAKARVVYPKLKLLVAAKAPAPEGFARYML